MIVEFVIGYIDE
ncbi:Protein of unknown function [Bacillus wiedmannii]|uniref:Uncharacterized protein n=1 Tax=Bacillus wiedmannii TaxID=1890302 RepID=A0A1C4A760_9BACI|nr:Protein of unknown function [Bacillus wiedmannii]